MATPSKVITPVYKYGSPDIGYYANYNDAVAALSKPGQVIPQTTVTTSKDALSKTNQNITKFDTVTNNLRYSQGQDVSDETPAKFDASIPKGGMVETTSKYGTYSPGQITPPNLKAANISISSEAKRNIRALENLRASMDNTSNALISNIQNKYKSLADSMTQKNNAIFSGLQNVGVVSGRQRYAPELQSSILSNELGEGQKRLNDLETEKMGLVLQAQQAKDANDFKVLNAISDAYDKAHTQQQKVLQDMFDNSIKLENLGIQRSQELRASNKDTLTNLAYVDPSSVSQEELSAIDSQMGMPSGFAKTYLEAAYSSTQATTQREKALAQKSYTDLLQSIPAGKEIQMPDGSLLTGLGSTSDIYTFEKEDASGKVTIVSFNKGNGQVKEYSAGRIGTPSATGGGGGDLGTRVSEFVNIVKSLKFDAQGNAIDNQGGAVPAQDVAYQLRQAYLEKYPGKGDEFTSSVIPFFPSNVSKTFNQ